MNRALLPGHVNSWIPVALSLFLSLTGAAFRATAGELIPAASNWRLFPATREPSPNNLPAWRAITFADTDFRDGRAPFFYGESLAGTDLTDMRGKYSSIYLRKTFQIEDVSKISTLTLDGLSDDGFIAWINGREVARYNVSDGDQPYTGVALGAVSEPLEHQIIEIPRPSELLVNGVNVLAIHAFNASLDGSSDFVFDASLSSATDSTAPTIAQIIPSAGVTVAELKSIEVTFSEAVRGIDAADLLINGVAATNVVQITPEQFSFEFPEPPAGAVEFRWRDGHGITDDLAAGNPFVSGAPWTLQLNPAAEQGKVVINEFLADNAKSLFDEDRDDSDWIELHNSGALPVNLLGWSLTDDPTLARLWKFPEVVLQPDSYLLIFASGKNRTNVAGKLHTDFRLTSDGEYLALVRPDGGVADAFAPKYPKQSANISYGRIPATDGVVGFMSVPTPGNVNSTEGGAGFSTKVEFSRNSGLFLESFQLALTTVDTNAVIRFTLNGAVPTNGSTLYTGPIAITNSAEVRARSFAPGLVPSPIHTETFVRLTNDPAHLATFESTLPILVIAQSGRAFSATRAIATHFTLHEPVNGKASLLRPPAWQTRGAAKTRGSSTGGLPKASFSIQWWDELNQDVSKGILGMPPATEWVLYAPNNFDVPLIHNPFMHQLANEMGQYSSRTRFVEVYTVRNGSVTSNAWQGIYVLEEKIAVDKDRVDIDKLRADDLTEPDVTGGYLMKFDRTGPGESGIGGAVMVEPKEVELRLPQRIAQRTYLSTYLQRVSTSFNGTLADDPTRGFRNFIEPDQWIDYHIREVLSGNVDAIVLSAYFHKPRNGRIRWGPHWDFDRALGSTDGRDLNPRQWSTGPFFSGWFGSFLRHRDSWQQWVDRWQEVRQDHLSRTNLNRIIDELAAEVRASEPRERRRWRNANRRADGRTGSGATYDTELDWMKNWLSNRVAYIDGQLTDRPTLSANGGRVTPGYQLTINVPAGATVYYTLDGSDPRPRGGTNDPSAQALIYSNPIPIQANTRVFARARNLNKRQVNGPPVTTPWSGPAVATFTVAPPPLALTELLFHPEPLPGDSNTDADEFEFLELRNISAQSVDLVGYHFTHGIEFRFDAQSAVKKLAPGERVVVAKNPTAFARRYPGITQVVGPFTGNLSDAGERLALAGPLEEPIFDFTYSDEWFPLTDGAGFSLVIRDDAALVETLDRPDVWRPSAVAGGSPNAADPAPGFIPAVRINEILANPLAKKGEAIELFNPSLVPADVSGWYLSDSLSELKKAKIPRGTLVPAGGYRVLNRADFDDLNLSANGETIYLASADREDRLSGWLHEVRYGAAEPGGTFGAADSTGKYFALQSRPTLGAVNALAAPPSVIISQFLTRSSPDSALDDDRYEFVQILNRSAAPVALFDPSRPANTWRLAGDASFDFPPDLTLAPGQILTLVSFDPRFDVPSRTAFIERHGPIAEATLAGPWRGALGNHRGSIRIERPGAPDTDGEVPYYTVEELQYDDVLGSGWPLTSHTPGFAARAFPQSPAVLPASWLPGRPCPGARDSNGNGLSDALERLIGSDPLLIDDLAARDAVLDKDADQDGATNGVEALLGTPLNDANLHITLLPGSFDYPEWRLRFSGNPTQTYRVQYRDGFSDPAWRDLKTIAPGFDLTPVVDRSTSQSRLYRVVSP